MTDLQAAVLVLVLAPAAIIAVVGMMRGYHIFIHLYRPEKKDEEK